MRLPNDSRWFQESGNPKTSRLALPSWLVFDLVNPKELRPQQQYQQVLPQSRAARPTENGRGWSWGRKDEQEPLAALGMQMRAQGL